MVRRFPSRRISYGLSKLNLPARSRVSVLRSIVSTVTVIPLLLVIYLYAPSPDIFPTIPMLVSGYSTTTSMTPDDTDEEKVCVVRDSWINPVMIRTTVLRATAPDTTHINVSESQLYLHSIGFPYAYAPRESHMSIRQRKNIRAPTRKIGLKTARTS